jgi:hypothetical protein
MRAFCSTHLIGWLDPVATAPGSVTRLVDFIPEHDCVLIRLSLSKGSC